MAEVRIKDIDEHEIDTILADDIDFEGKLTFKKPLMIKGKFKGEISSSSALYVGDKAVVEAKVEAGLVSSRGRIKGDIVGHNRVELSSTAQVEGDITTPDFVVESGCKFNGYCNMGGQRQKPQAAAKPAQPAGQQTPAHGPAKQAQLAGLQSAAQAPAGQQNRPNPGPQGQPGGQPTGGNR